MAAGSGVVRFVLLFLQSGLGAGCGFGVGWGFGGSSLQTLGLGAGGGCGIGLGLGWGFGWAYGTKYVDAKPEFASMEFGSAGVANSNVSDEPSLKIE